MKESIVNLRIKKKITQKELADKLGITQGAVSQWESGVSQPSISLLPKLAEALDCNISDLFSGKLS